jgi:hypothetical protein
VEDDLDAATADRYRFLIIGHKTLVVIGSNAIGL